MPSPRQEIAKIDCEIDAIIAAAVKRNGRRPASTAGAWQKVWDAYPDLADKYFDLYAERGRAQLIRDREDHAALLHSKPRKLRRQKCPTCGRAA